MDDFAEEEVVENPTIRAAYNLAPLHQSQPLRWDYEVHLIGEKIYDKIIHLCETCELPILVYGRLLPCKHIFCFDCARKCDKSCKRCAAKVQKVEKSALGTVYVCTHGAPKHSTKGCRRTYLSQRDLQAHIAHRHMPKASSSSSTSSSTSAQSQPAPNQLPLTKQQAAQQAAQKQLGTQDMHHASPVQSHHQQSVLPVQSSLVSPVPHHLTHQQSGLPVNSQQMSPAAQLIPGLGDSRTPMATAAHSVMGHNSPLMQPAASPGAMQQGMGLPYGSAPQANPDMFHSLEMGQQPGIPGSHMQAGQTHQPYPQPAQFPPGMMPQMGSQQLQPSVPPPLHPPPFGHPHTSMPVPPNMDNYSEPQPRTNVNLITVPIQDEGQYRPLPNINSSVGPHPGGPYPQTRPSMPSQTIAFTQPVLSSSTYSSPTTFPHMVGQPPPHMQAPDSPQGLPFNQPNAPFNQLNAPVNQPNALHPNNPGHIVNSRPGIGGSLHQGGHPMTVGVVRPQGGAGLMPTPVAAPGGQGVVNRFPPHGQWPPQRSVHPSLTQGQQQQQQRPPPPLMETQFQPSGRPQHNENQFQQSGRSPHTETQFQQSGRPPHAENLFQPSGRPPHSQTQFQQGGRPPHTENQFQQGGRPPHADNQFQPGGRPPPHTENQFMQGGRPPPHTENQFQQSGRPPPHNENQFQQSGGRPPHADNQFQQSGRPPPQHTENQFQQGGRPPHADNQFQQSGRPPPPHNENQFQQGGRQPPHTENQFQQGGRPPPHTENQFQQSGYYH
ncbi:unnamed protein product [Candidula unifasciata]|uniref:E3 ubiquitin-protein ligase Hakai n=1 Tax=Candidula unifasciata TaxID=100452 RepID=A0A8S4A932_9EUPU|nr:unnamed protein product [Candidula unifasciata]